MTEQPATPGEVVINVELPVSLPYARDLFAKLGRALAAADAIEEATEDA